MKRIFLNLLYSILLLSLFFGGIEIVLRKTHLFGSALSWTEPDPLLRYRYIAGSHYWYNKENDHPITGKINSYGWRDKEWSLIKPSNTFRIAALGDSMVDAFQVESDQTFLALAEERLNKTLHQDIKVELMNFGRSGAGQTEEMIILEREVVKFSPDMVLVFFLPYNDIVDLGNEINTNSNGPVYHVSENGQLILDTSFVDLPKHKIYSFLSRIKKYSALVSLVSERYHFLLARIMGYKFTMTHRSGKGGLLQKENKVPPYLSLCTANPNAIFLRNYELNKKLIKAMAEFSKENGMKFMLITWDILSYLPEMEKQCIEIAPTFDTNYFEDDLGEFARSIDVDYLGLQRIFRRAYDNSGLPLHWETPRWAFLSKLDAYSPHLNYEGHKVVADALINKLRPIIYFQKKKSEVISNPLYGKEEQLTEYSSH